MPSCILSLVDQQQQQAPVLRQREGARPVTRSSLCSYSTRLCCCGHCPGWWGLFNITNIRRKLFPKCEYIQVFL